MKSWIINKWYYDILFLTISGTAAYLVWRFAVWKLEKLKKLRYVCPLLVAVMGFFLLPILNMWFRATHKVMNGTRGYLYMCTPFLLKMRLILFAVWASGVGCSIIRYLYQFQGMRGWLKSNMLPAEENIVRQMKEIRAGLHIHQKVCIYRSYAVTSPMVTGVLRKKIILPTAEYEDKELKAILYHEMMHIRQHIVEWKYIAVWIQMIYWFNPCAYALLRRLDEWGETACDLAVRYNSCCGMTFREYFSMVVKGIEDGQEVFSGSVTQFQKIKGVGERMRRVKNYKREKDLKLAGGIFLMAIFISLSAITAMAAGLGMEKVHETVYKATESAEKEKYEKLTYIEYEEVLTEEEREKMIEVSIQQYTRSIIGAAWEMEPDSVCETESFDVEGADSIMLSVKIVPDNAVVRAGIITPGGNKRYVNGKGEIQYTFDLREDGEYSIFVENISDETISVECSCIY